MTGSFNNKIIQLVESRIGLDPQSVSGAFWQKAIDERMAVNRISHWQEYYSKLVASPEEFQAFIELIVVPETWFFRDERAFEFLVDYVKHTWLKRESEKRILRILSFPCSTGEEAYSIAFTLLEAGAPLEKFTIDAIDISLVALDKAQKGKYGANSFRNKNKGIPPQFFSQANKQWIINKNVQKSVHFSYGNFLDPLFLSGKSPYEIIFCRNLFIYLLPSAQEHLLKVFDKFLLPQGALIVGPAETELVRNFGYKKETYIGSCAFYKPHFYEKKEKFNAASSSVALDIKKTENVKRQDKTPPPPFNPVVIEKNPAPYNPLKEARSLADEGRFKEAYALCENYLERHEQNAEAYFLLALISHASGEEEKAEKLFHKAIYLQPDYYEALVYLALLAEKQGKKKEASLLRERAERSKQSKDKK